MVQGQNSRTNLLLCSCGWTVHVPTFQVGRNERINYAKGLLQREFLPHVGVGAGTEAKKVLKEVPRGFGWVLFRASYLYYILPLSGC